MTLDDFGFLGRAARVVLEVFTLWKDHVDALVASSAGSKREGCPFAAVLCQVELLQSEDASLRCVGTQTLMQVAKVGKNGFTSFTCRTLLAKWDICAQYWYRYFFCAVFLDMFRVTTQSLILQFAWNSVHMCRQESGNCSRVSTWKTNSFRCSWTLTQTRVLAVCLEMTGCNEGREFRCIVVRAQARASLSCPGFSL